jgi:hypothetical protein
VRLAHVQSNPPKGEREAQDVAADDQCGHAAMPPTEILTPSHFPMITPNRYRWLQASLKRKLCA